VAGVRGRVLTPLRASSDGSLQLLPPRVYLTSPAVAVNPGVLTTVSFTADVLAETGVGGVGHGMWVATDPTRITITDPGLYQATVALTTTAGTALRDRGLNLVAARGGVTFTTLSADTLSRADGAATTTHVLYDALSLEVGDTLVFQFAHLMAAAVNMSSAVYVEKIGTVA
jgi:hypothetical protein